MAQAFRQIENLDLSFLFVRIEGYANRPCVIDRQVVSSAPVNATDGES